MPNNLVLPKGAAAGGGSRGRSSSTAGSTGGGSGSVFSGATSSAAGVPGMTRPAALSLLSLGKLSRVVAAFMSYAYLRSAVALPLYLFIVTAGAAICLNALQRPWSGRRIGAKRAKRILVAGAITALMLYVWSAGLRSAGPLRALLIDGAELPLLYVFAVASGRELPEKMKTRGACFMLAAYALLIWDASGQAPDIAQLEQSKLARSAEKTFGRFGNITSEKFQHLARPHAGPAVALPHVVVNREQQNQHRERRRMLLEAAGHGDPGANNSHENRKLDSSNESGHVHLSSGSLRDAFVEGTPLRSELGVLLVLASSVILQASRPFTRRLSAELGGAKRHFALSVTAATICLSPFALLSYISTASGALLSMNVIGGVARVPLSTNQIMGFAMVGFLWLVLPYYIRAIVSTALDQRTALKAGVMPPARCRCNKPLHLVIDRKADLSKMQSTLPLIV